MAKRKPGADTVRVRVLTDCHVGAANAVIELPAEEADQACALGLADADPAAVEYAESIAQ